MSQLSCNISSELLSKMQKFRFQKDIQCGVLTFKINKKLQQVELEEEDLDTDFDSIRQELPEDSPRYLVLSYRQEFQDGRVKFPLVFIHYAPQGVNAELNMLFTTTRPTFVEKAKLTTVLELQDREEFTKEWVDSQLNRF